MYGTARQKDTLSLDATLGNLLSYGPYIGVASGPLLPSFAQNPLLAHTAQSVTGLLICVYLSFSIGIHFYCFEVTYINHNPIPLSLWESRSNLSYLYAARQCLDILYPCEQLRNISSHGATMSALYLARVIATSLKLLARHLFLSKDMATSMTSEHEILIPTVCNDRYFLTFSRSSIRFRNSLV